jgi:hypothetical protein
MLGLLLGDRVMLFIDATEIRRVLLFPMVIAALEAGHRRPKIEIQNGYLGDEKAQYFVRHAADRGRYMASKLITSFPGNLSEGRFPAVQAVCVLFDGTNGRPLALLDGTEITYWRTAADSALGAKFLAPPDPDHARPFPGAYLDAVGHENYTRKAWANGSHDGPLSPTYAAVAQLVERNLPKVDVEGPNPFCRSSVAAVVPRVDSGRSRLPPTTFAPAESTSQP